MLRSLLAVQKSDLRDEDMAAASARMIELLLLLNYKHGMDLYAVHVQKNAAGLGG